MEYKQQQESRWSQVTMDKIQRDAERTWLPFIQAMQKIHILEEENKELKFRILQLETVVEEFLQKHDKKHTADRSVSTGTSEAK